MRFADSLNIRLAGPEDADAVAALHADSWRRHYRGAYSDAFLDGEVAQDRLAVWTERLGAADASTCTILAEDGGILAGFAHTIFDQDPVWGALLDNLHVAHGLKRHGIGSILMARTAAALGEQRPASGLFLWVLEQNTAAQAFYEANGGRRGDRVAVSAPGGRPDRLNGSPFALRYAWPDPGVLTNSRGVAT